MKHLFTILLALVATTASAQDFVVDGICYNILSEDDRTVEVTNNPDGYAGDIVIPAEVTYDGRTYQVTTIGEQAFGWCDDLTSVSMPSVTTIGEEAFIHCDSLTSVSIPASCTSIGLNPFELCPALKEIVVDENNPNYSSIDGALYDKDKTTIICWPTAEGDIDIMPSVTTISRMAFYHCYALKSISMPGVITIDDYAFNNCRTLASVDMPEATMIGDLAFTSCYALASVDMPAVTMIGEDAFTDCRNLTSVSMRAVITISNYAFYHAFALRTVDIPATLTTIGERVFIGCDGLTSVYCHWEDPLECNPGFGYNVYEDATLYVPTGTIDAYRNVYPWSEFINIVEKDYSGIADTPGSELSIKVIDGAIVIEGGDGTASAPVVEVYSAGGVCVYRGTDSVIGGLTHGVYVVKVGDTVHKVAL